jgi:4a-hydroxytetrahydrobiopterin dehydratase
MKVLTDEELTAGLAKQHVWRLEAGSLISDWEFVGFPAAIQFVAAVAEVAEHFNHHPDIDIRYNRVHLGLTTHDAGGITELDLAVARAIAALRGS